MRCHLLFFSCALFLNAAVSADITKPQYAHYMHAVASNDLSTVKEYLSMGVDINADLPTRHGHTTALITAAHYNQLQMVEFLLSEGADRSIHDSSGKRPCDHTDKDKSPRIYETLDCSSGY